MQLITPNLNQLSLSGENTQYLAHETPDSTLEGIKHVAGRSLDETVWVWQLVSIHRVKTIAEIQANYKVTEKGEVVRT